MQVREILRIKGKVLFTTTPDHCLADAVAAMAENDVGSLAVMGEGKMQGLLTFREVLKAVDESKGNIAAMRVEEVMMRNPMTAHPNMETNELRRLLLANHQRYVPVMDGTTLMGVLSLMDVAKSVLEDQTFENQMLKTYIKHWPAEERVG